MLGQNGELLFGVPDIAGGQQQAHIGNARPASFRVFLDHLLHMPEGVTGLAHFEEQLGLEQKGILVPRHQFDGALIGVQGGLQLSFVFIPDGPGIPQRCLIRVLLCQLGEGLDQLKVALGVQAAGLADHAAKGFLPMAADQGIQVSGGGIGIAEANFRQDRQLQSLLVAGILFQPLLAEGQGLLVVFEIAGQLGGLADDGGVAGGVGGLAVIAKGDA